MPASKIQKTKKELNYADRLLDKFLSADLRNMKEMIFNSTVNNLSGSLMATASDTPNNSSWIQILAP